MKKIKRNKGRKMKEKQINEQRVNIRNKIRFKKEEKYF